LSERFSPAELDRLEPTKREEWKRLVRSKAAAVAGDAHSLSSQLATVFGSQPADGGPIDMTDAADLSRSAQRLFGLAAASERQINQSFSVSAGSSSSAEIKSVQFWRNLKQMADIAAEIQKF